MLKPINNNNLIVIIFSRFGARANPVAHKSFCLHIYRFCFRCLHPKPQFTRSIELPTLNEAHTCSMKTNLYHSYYLFLLVCRLDVQYETIDYLYTPTYTRVGAYFIGVFAGWYLSHYDRKMDISKVFMRRIVVFE